MCRVNCRARCGASTVTEGSAADWANRGVTGMSMETDASQKRRDRAKADSMESSTEQE
jgi:hypothetical protein